MEKITSILDTKSAPPPLNPNSTINTNLGVNSNTSFWENIKNIPFLTWVLIILILALLGFNIFIYLAAGTQGISAIFTKFLGILGITSKNIVDVSLEGSKKIVTGTANVYDNAAIDIQNQIDSTGSSEVNPSTSKTSLNNDNYSSPPLSNIDEAQSTSLNKALNSAQNSNNDYEADDASSTIQTGSSKAGWCFIGEDRGFRTCAEVGISDTCMSGDIFPSKEICINPKLRQ